MSTLRYCELYLATNGKWYLDLANSEHGQKDDCTTYGPFPSEDAAMKELANHSNPGGHLIDRDGIRPPPTKSPNGSPIWC